MEHERRELLLQVAMRIADSLVEAQRVLWTLNAIHYHSSTSPEIDESRRFVMDQIWRGLFDRLYMKIGSVIEKTEGAGNLNYLRSIVTAGQDLDPTAASTIDLAFVRLEKLDELRQWRNKVVAHNDLGFDAEAFYEKHKMHVSNYQLIVDELYEVLNTISLLTSGTVYLKPDERDHERLLREAGDLYTK